MAEPARPALRAGLLLLLLALGPGSGTAQVDSVVLPEPSVVDIQFLIVEAMLHNQEIQASLADIDAAQASSRLQGTLDPPQFRYMREEMPSFRWSEAMYSRYEIMQMFRFPTKLTTERELGNIRAEHALHDEAEVVNMVVAKLKAAYARLWFVQQQRVLVGENMRLMKGIEALALGRYRGGSADQPDVLRAQMELTKLENALLVNRQEELGAKAELMAMLNRSGTDTLGWAVIPEDVEFSANLDSLEAIALQQRPMLVHDSLTIREGETEQSLARQGYLPDLSLGLQYVTSPLTGFTGWGISAGVTLPFVPWTLGRTGADVEKSGAAISSARARYLSAKAMVLASVRDNYYQAASRKASLDNYRRRILPQAAQILESLTKSYEAGKADMLVLLDAYMKRVDAVAEYFQLRLDFELSVAQLELSVGLQGAAGTR